MSDKKSLCENNSISKLRALREKLCAGDGEWKKAFEVRDYVIGNLRKLQIMLDDDSIEKTVCSSKLKEILEYYEDNNNV